MKLNPLLDRFPCEFFLDSSLYLPIVAYKTDWLNPFAQQSSHPCASVPVLQLHSTGQLPYKSSRAAESDSKLCDAETILSFSWRHSLRECDKLGSPTLKKVTSDWLYSQGSARLGTLWGCGSSSGLYISSSSIGKLRRGLWPLYGCWRGTVSSRVCGWSSGGVGRGRSWLSLWSTWRGIKVDISLCVYIFA